MALFAIQRFMGDEEEFEEHSSTKASCILEKLRDEALARKQKRLGDQSLKHLSKKKETENPSSETLLSSSKRKQKLKRKDKQNDIECLSLVADKSVGKTKKGKRKSERLEVAELINTNNVSSEKHDLTVFDGDSSVGSPKLHKKSQKNAESLDKNEPSVEDVGKTKKRKRKSERLEGAELSDTNTEGDTNIGSPKHNKRCRKDAESLDKNEPSVEDVGKTRKRKSERLEGAELSDTNTEGDTNIGSPKHNKRCRKVDSRKDDSRNEAEPLDENKPSVENVGKSKKRKRKSERPEGAELSDNNNVSNTETHDLSVIEGDTSIGSPKGKKKSREDDSLEHAEPLNENGPSVEDVTTNSASQHGEIENKDHSRQDGPHEIGGFTILGDYKKKQVEKVKRVLPYWLTNPSVITADLKSCQVSVSSITRLHPVILNNLSKNGITQFFPVQSQVIPVLLDVVKHGIQVGPGGYQPSDICVSAPTGSGKTLAFVLPIVQALKDCVVRKVRAIAVLPVRDLASQVHKVFQAYCDGTNVKVGLLVGQKTFEGEQIMLVKKKHLGYQSLVDILVTTPGRLVDHINNTSGLDLTHLRFLVIDEADRMIEDIKQDWLQTLENAVYRSDSTIWGSCSREKPGAITVASSQKNQIPLQKLLFSATLSQNPEKLQNLNLFQPKLFTSVIKTTKQDLSDKAENEMSGDFVGKYTTPAGLTEYFIESSKAERPLVVLHFLHTLKFRQVLCFTKSVQATHRLYLLIKLIGGIEVKEFSSGLHATRRSKILRKFSAGQIDILICSDALARGMDIENVKYVISYDVPTFIKTYIHRVGRTARAGKTGTTFTLLEQKEVFHFKKMIREAGKTGVKEMKLGSGVLEPHVPAYENALEQLPEIIKTEKTRTTK